MNIGSFGKPSLVKTLQPAFWLVSNMMMFDVCHKVIRGVSIGVSIIGSIFKPVVLLFSLSTL